MSVNKLLFNILRSAIWNVRIEDSFQGDDFLKIISLSEQQTVLGLVFDILEKQSVNGLKDKMVIFETIAKVENIKQQNKLVNSELKEFTLRCNQEGIDYIIVKGQTMGCLYPKPILRQPGDIDFLLCKSYSESKSSIENILSVSLPEKMLEYEVGIEKNNIRYELHINLRGWAKKKHQKIWNNLMVKEWEKKHYVEVDGLEVRTLSPTLNAAYVFIHLFFHFIREGVSLRQICDWVMVLHHYKDQINREELRNILQSLDVYDAYRAFGAIIVDELDLPLEEFPFAINEEDRKWKGVILKDIFDGGNFGNLYHQAKQTWLYKYETMRIAIKNSFRYYHLCPSEVGWMIPRLIKGNFKILFS